MKSVFEVVVVVVHGLGYQIAGGTRRNERHVQTRRPGFEGKDDLADIAADDRDYLVLVHRALEGAHRVGGGRVIVISNDFDLAAVDAAMGVDVVGSHDGGPGQRSARH